MAILIDQLVDTEVCEWNYCTTWKEQINCFCYYHISVDNENPTFNLESSRYVKFGIFIKYLYNDYNNLNSIYSDSDSESDLGNGHVFIWGVNFQNKNRMFLTLKYSFFVRFHGYGTCIHKHIPCFCMNAKQTCFWGNVLLSKSQMIIPLMGNPLTQLL